MLNSHEIRQRFLNFFEKRDHSILRSAPLITSDNESGTNQTLFNTAGMQPLVPFLMGQEHPEGKRLASAQKCVRTGDLDEIGDNTHLTFFEMLGNWSLGDYFKKEAIQYSWEFLTDQKEGLGLDPSRLYVTVFAGNDLVPRDLESVELWKQYVPEHRIYFRDSKDNWWTAGSDSPAGPSTEMFYDLTGELGDLTPEAFEQADEDQQLVEIWNDVFMAYRQERGEIVGQLPQKNVDTGAGLERVTAVVQGVSHVFETDLFAPLIVIVKEHAEVYNERHARIIADHIKTAVFMLQDGIVVSNTGRGYVLRRILRRVYSSLNEIGMSEQHLPRLVHAVIQMYGDLYFSDVNEKQINLKIKVIATEMDKIIAIVKRGRTYFKKIKDAGTTELDGKTLANLRQTQGLPLGITQQLAQKFGITISEQALKDYQEIQDKHQQTSRQAAAGKFKGGLTEDTPKVRALHTATHLMLAGLRKFVAPDIMQRGSNITEARTRFDFNHEGKVPTELLKKVEDYVNTVIRSGAKVGIQLMKKNDAQQQSDIVGSFWERYPETVKIYHITGKDGTVYSRELCGGPHANDMSELAAFGDFKILKEEASSAGVRRIKANLQ